MKKVILVICVAVLGVVLPSCSRTAIPESPIRKLDASMLLINLDDAGFALSVLPDCNSVSLKDINQYARQFSCNTKSGDVDYAIEPVVDGDNDTLMYVVKYTKGWEMVSADRRVQPILAMDYESNYQDIIKEDGISLWLSMMAMDMKAVIHASDDELTIPKEEQERNKRFWESFCNINDFVKANIAKTKSGGDPSHPPIPWDEGEYVLISTTATSAVYDTIPHLIPLQWGQYAGGINECCPFRTDTSYLHAKAGCVPVAAGQILYYLHYHLGVPVQAPSTGYNTGNIDNPDLHLDNWNSTVWDIMPELGSSVCAPFIAEVGQTFGVNYHNDGTGLDPLELSRNKFWNYSIDCDSSSFNANTIYTSLLAGSPVLMSAFGIRIEANDYQYEGGHAFIIDAYRRNCTKFTRVYKWVYYDQSIPHLIAPEDSISVTYENPYLALFKMNWGHGTKRGNGTWYAATGDWYYSGNNNGQQYTHNYIYERRMLYNFQERQ